MPFDDGTINILWWDMIPFIVADKNIPILENFKDILAGPWALLSVEKLIFME